jgi:hypothetical protein
MNNQINDLLDKLENAIKNEAKTDKYMKYIERLKRNIYSDFPNEIQKTKLKKVLTNFLNKRFGIQIYYIINCDSNKSLLDIDNLNTFNSEITQGQSQIIFQIIDMINSRGLNSFGL